MPAKDPARHERAAIPSVGIALAGGGPLGGIYEVGALIALADSLDGIEFNDLDVYVGVSSGSFVAAALANGISPTQMYRLFVDDGADASLSRALFLRPALGEFARRGLSLARLIAGAALAQFRIADRRGALESIAALGAVLSRTIPTGLFDQGGLDRLLTRLFSAPTRSNDFRELRRKLFVIATNLDTGASTTFGGPGFEHVPIARAVEASAALPGLFPPVEIDGVDYVDGALNKTMHASDALETGVRLLFCVNPLVPFDASPVPGRDSFGRLAQGGLPMVLAQTFRAIIHSRMEVGMSRYRAQYPDADILLFEPDREDADMFSASIFSYARRQALCEDAYRKTRKNLLARHAAMRPLLARHGIRLKVEVLSDSGRSMGAALTDTRPLRARRPGVRQAARDLSHTLDRLQAVLAAGR